ncbi:origin recognition complex subunit 3, putative [Talaromyces stipitatus ATCC 10500]|uniref:Origin recognition complex subunit 3, putative n=1 Tax=Talaromyces stipitatus (strain ATCC 10500 / CBS 375.48 / QM 6759 / NRRL 1006) TaxID=441959 RepID=B8MHN9_TALSN|nr:origin recognition complex subunit 3, putative [Talaromyces stipitatus ATCC 10500]EED16020.1 origin recognition complex subunit 3, putative [Talaromyces stipitatus ATCC 10500]
MELDSEFGSSEDLGIYVYHPTDNAERSSKRRKVSTNIENKPQKKNQSRVFVPLLGGKESADLVDVRKSTFEELWSSQEERCRRVIDELDSGILKDITSFVETASPDAYNGCIPTSLVTIGSNVSALPRLLDILHRRLISDKSGQVILLESGDAPNLKAVLKTIIRTAVTSTSGNDAYQNLFADKSGPRMLPYDLNVLYQYVISQGSKSLVLAFRDSEAFDSGVLNDLLSLLSSWVDRLPLVLLFGISTTVELFEGRLSRSTVALLHGKQFEIHEAEGAIDRIYETLQASPDTKLWLGPHLSTSLIEKARDHFQGPEGFIREVKYAYMSHFFANPLSILLSSFSSKQKELYEAVRNLKSFRSFCEQLVEESKAESVRALLVDDDALRKQVHESIENGLTQMKELFYTMNTLRSVQNMLQLTKVNNNTDTYIRGLSGDLSNSTSIKDLFSRLQKIDSDSFKGILATLQEGSNMSAPLVDVSQYEEDLQSLLAIHNSNSPLRSEHDDQNTTIKTSIAQDKVNLTKTKKKISNVDAAYTEVLEKFLEDFETSLSSKLINPQNLFLHEVFVFDLRNPLRDTFAPRVRFSIERALSTPFDYLASTSSTTGEEGGNLSARQPETAILYQLYLESGSLVNVFDLWKAFSTIICGEDSDTESRICDERLALMLFYRAMSELKTLGMIKPSRKKIDHVSKSAWKGL